MGYVFDNPNVRFTLKDDKIDVLRSFLNGKFTEDGYYIRAVAHTRRCDSTRFRFSNSRSGLGTNVIQNSYRPLFEHAIARLSSGSALQKQLFMRPGTTMKAAADV